MIKQLLKNEFVYLDGAMGTVLQRSGLKLGQKPEILNFTDSELIKSIHEQYFKAGSNIICANTFGANSHKLQGSGYTVTQVVEKAVQNAKSVANKYGGYVALDIGPIGLLLEPSGTLSFEHAYKIFKEIVVAGKNAGADLVLLETMTDLYEIKAGILAVKENCDLPIFATMTFEENALTFTGC